MPALQELEAELKTHDANLEEIEGILASMPDYQEALDMKADVLAQKREVQRKIALLNPHDAAAVTEAESTTVAVQSRDAAANTTTSTPTTITTSTSATTTAVPGRHDAPQDGPQQVFKVNESVLAKYAADRQFYPATVVAVMGSASAPIYTVKFKGYEGTETARWRDVKPMSSSVAPVATATTSSSSTSSSAAQKRKADGTPTVSSSSALPAPAPPSQSSPTPITVQIQATNHGSVISAPANINAALAAQIKKDPAKVNDGPARTEKPAKKVKTNKALDKAKGSWQDWQKKSGSNSKVAKVANKESMFRTGQDHTARVGFTGSGKTMTKDIARAKHKYEEKNKDYYD